MRTEPFNNL